MNISDSVQTFNSTGCGFKLFNPCMECISCSNVGQSVCPLEPVAPRNSEFFEINSNVKIRVVHVKPEKVEASVKVSSLLEKRSTCSSLSEEYWFTRWNKPLKNDNCDYSFRRSLRLSRLSCDNALKTPAKSYKICISIKIINIETFVERLIQETFLQAFEEYLAAKKKNIKEHTGGVVNLGFVSNSGDLTGVVLRKKDTFQSPAILSVDCITQQPLTNNNNALKGIDNMYCQSIKPLIILLHGIGSSADLWWNIINSLVAKGFEIIAPDMLGHGYSSVPKRRSLYSFKNLVNNLVAIFDQYVTKHESQKCILIAHSFGCSLATALYRFRSQQINQLILISGGGPTPLASPVNQMEMSMFSCAEFLLKPLLICGLKRRFFYSSRGKYFEPCEKDNAVPKHVLESIAYGQNWPEGDAAYHRRILIPTLLVHGIQDTQVTLVQECEMERTMPRAFLELIPNAGHLPMLETPEHLSHMILCFIDWWSQ